MFERHMDVSNRGGIRHVLAEAIRQLHPRRQLEHGPEVFLYVGAIAATAAGLVELVARRGHPGQVLILALLLWLILFAGDVLLALTGDEPDDEAQADARQSRPETYDPHAAPSPDKTRGRQ